MPVSVSDRGDAAANVVGSCSGFDDDTHVVNAEPIKGSTMVVG